MSRWFWWLGPPLFAVALLLVFATHPVAIEIALSYPGTIVVGLSKTAPTIRLG